LYKDGVVGEEDIKWNARSFRTSEHFATFHLRAQGGAKARDSAVSGIAVDDPESMLEWLAKDRAAVTFRDPNDVGVPPRRLCGDHPPVDRICLARRFRKRWSDNLNAFFRDVVASAVSSNE
jgi:hypothetical protein